MFVILLLAAAAILGGVVLAALGRAGEMTVFPGDYPPLDLGEVSATDVALLRPPMALWGYNLHATEDSLQVIAQSVSARDVEIATLRRELAELRAREGTARPGYQAGTASGELPGYQGSAASGELPGYQGSAASGELPGYQGSAASGELPGYQGSAAAGEPPGSQAGAAAGELPSWLRLPGEAPDE